MADCTEDLRAEHRGVLLMLDILGEMEDRFEQGRPVPAEDVRQTLDFLKTFVDRCHHAKEEGLLFPAMREARVPDSAGTIERLEREHREGRALVARIEEEADRLDAGDVTVGRELAEDMHSYGELLRRHIELEDDVLYPMAVGALPASEQARLVGEYERVERDEVGEGRHEAFHEMLGRMKADYLDRSESLKSG